MRRRLAGVLLFVVELITCIVVTPPRAEQVEAVAGLQSKVKKEKGKTL